MPIKHLRVVGTIALISSLLIAGQATATTAPSGASMPQAMAGAPAPIYLLSSSCPYAIVQGQKSGCVTELQTLLNGYGARLVVDGIFGPATLAAVRSFQASKGLVVDGSVGPATKTALYVGLAPAPINLNSSSCPYAIVQGQRSGCVTELQRLLNGYGAGLVVDGIFGAATLAAVRGFQSARGLVVDGSVGPATKAALYGASPTPTAPPAVPTPTAPPVSPTPTAPPVVPTPTAPPVVGAPAPIYLLSASCPYAIVKGQKSGCVTELQILLNGYGAGLVVDGIFGAATLAAVRSYQSSNGLVVDGSVGPATKAALYGTSPTPSAPPVATAPGGFLDVAVGEIGVAEGTARANQYGVAVNRTDSTNDYSWCAAFVSWVAMRSGATPFRSARVYDWVAEARQGESNLSLTTSPAPGDIVAFDWEGDGNFTGTQHIGIVRTVGSDGWFKTVEGNTGNPNGSNDGVYSKDRCDHCSVRKDNRPYNVVFIRIGAHAAAAAPQPGSVPAAISLLSASCQADLMQGRYAGCVADLQNLLRQLGSALSVQGVRQLIMALIRAYQAAAGIVAGGSAGPATPTAPPVVGAPAPIYLLSSSCPYAIVKGQKSGCVTELQNLLNGYGAGLVVDGNFGPATLAAVRSYQSSKGLVVDGSVGPATKGALYGKAPTQAAPVAADCSAVTGPVDQSNTVVVGGIRVHPCLAESLSRMLDNAAAAGVTLSGTGWRSTARQIVLRRKNCHSDKGDYYIVYQMAPGSCSPATAIPGRSLHERGLAIDFSNCAVGSAAHNWLLKNAGKYGLKSLVAKEPWHWSTTGH